MKTYWEDLPSNIRRRQCRHTGETFLPATEDSNTETLGRLPFQPWKMPMQRHWGNFPSRIRRHQCRHTGETCPPATEDSNAETLGRLPFQPVLYGSADPDEGDGPVLVHKSAHLTLVHRAFLSLQTTFHFIFLRSLCEEQEQR